MDMAAFSRDLRRVFHAYRVPAVEPVIPKALNIVVYNDCIANTFVKTKVGELWDMDKKAENSYPRDMISVVCPCCGELVPVELILNAGGISSYLDIVGINEGGYSEKDSSKPWPVVALEVKADEKRLIDDRMSSMLKQTDGPKVETKVKIVPEL